jgi:hypothetical protein
MPDVTPVSFTPAATPELPARFTAVRYKTRTRTNWHHECAGALAAGALTP